MGRNQGKAPQRLARPGRPASGEQESGSASADGAPSQERRSDRGQAVRARPAAQPATAGDQGTAGGRRKPIAEENGDCRRPGAGSPPEAQERQGSARREGRGPRGGRRGRLEEGSLSRGEGRGGRRRRKGKDPGPSAQRGRRAPRSLDGDTSGGDGGSSRPDSEAREAQESGSQRIGARELRPTLEPRVTGSEGTKTGPESALEPSSDSLDSNWPRADPWGREGSSGTGPLGASEHSGDDSDSSLLETGPGRGPRAAMASRTFEGSSRAPRDTGPAQDACDNRAQRGAKPETMQASTARAPRHPVRKAAGRVPAAAGEGEAGAPAGVGPEDPAPLAALLVVRRLLARSPPGTTSQAVGPRRAGLKEPLLSVARALGLLRWLRRRLRLRPRPPEGEGQGAGPRASEGWGRGKADDGLGHGRGSEGRGHERGDEGRDHERGGEGRGPEPGLRHRLALRLAGLAGLGGRPRAPPGVLSRPPQVRTSPVPDDPFDQEDGTPDPKFAVVFPRIHRAGRASSSRSSEEASTDAPTGKGRSWPRAGAGGHSEGRRASEEGVSGLRRGSLLAPTAPDRPSLDESGSSSEAESETLDDEPPVHWAQGSGPRKGPRLGAAVLLPRLALETRLQQEGDPGLRGSLRERWEPEDEDEAVLERDLELSLGPGLEAPPFPGAEGRSLGDGLEDMEDLARLRLMCDSSVLLCLKKRFHLGRIYTFGGPLLLVLNPHRPLPLFSPEVQASYHPRKALSTTPHIFAIVASAYDLAQHTGQDPCILLRGHSGSGKTEASKKIVQFLSSLEQDQTRNRGCQVEDVLPILSSFGHAKTILNANASRFGQVFCLYLQQGVIVGASVSHYLLETSRVVFQALRVNGLEQLCNNLASERLQLFSSQMLLAQEEEECRRELLSWVPVRQPPRESCLDLLVDQPHSLLSILDAQTWLSQATDHTFLQKSHYHHGDHPSYAKPRLPLPVFTVQHYAGTVTYQVHKFLNRNRDQLDPAVVEMLGQSQLQLVGSLFQEAEPQSRGGRGRPTLASRFQQALGDLIARLGRSHVYFIQCLNPNPGKLPGLFDVGHVTEQLHQAAILEAVGTRSANFPVRVPFGAFLARFQALGSEGQEGLSDREKCGTILSQVLGAESPLCHLGATKVLLQEQGWQRLEELRDQQRSQALVNLHHSFHTCISRQRVLPRMQARMRGFQARKRCLRRRAALGQLNTILLVAQPLLRRRQRLQLGHWQGWHSSERALERVPSMELGRLEIPAELAVMLKTAEGHQDALAGSITECLPPEVPARPSLTLPPDIDRFPFSSFVSIGFQEPSLPRPGQPLVKPLTQLDGENPQHALDINKVMLRLLGDGSLESWQRQTMGTYLVRQGQCRPGLRNELFSQLVAQLWQNPDEQQSQRGWALMAVLLSAFPPLPVLQKPLLKFVSDQAPRGMAALCQHKLLGALEQSQLAPGATRAHPPTQLEWMAGWRRGRMALDVFTFSEECYSAEVESWTTGEQLAGWILQSRGLEVPPRGWSVSLHSRDTWQDLAGCDFVLDLISQTEDLGDPAAPHSYPITPLGSTEAIPLAPGIQAPSLPPGPPPGPAPTLPSRDHTGEVQRSGSLDGFLDQIFQPVMSSGLSDLEQSWALSSRMKGGGAVGPTQQGYPMVYPGMIQMPGYQPGMVPAPMPMMPAMGTVPAMPAMVVPPQPPLPSLDAGQLAIQQQNFINQQALILAQQMTAQAMTLSLEQQTQQRQRQARASEAASQASPSAITSKPRKPPTPLEKPQHDLESEGGCLRETSEEAEDRPCQPKSFQQKRNYFQKMGQPQITVRTVKPPAKVQIPQGEAQEEEEEEQEEQEVETRAVPSPPPPPIMKKPLKQGGAKAAKEAEAEPVKETAAKGGGQGPAQGRGIVVRSSDPKPKRPQPSREIGNIIRMYQSRPGPVPVPVQPSRPPKTFLKKIDPKDEALAKLGINGAHSSPPMLSSSPGKGPPPAVAPRPKAPLQLGPSSSIKEKQGPLLDLFGQKLPTAQTPPPPPAPPLPLPEDPGTLSAERRCLTQPMEDQGVSTQLLAPSGSVCFSYTGKPWKLFLRKEVFYPRENLSHPYYLRLLCEQILRDTFSESCIRISQDERRKMKDLLGDLEVDLDSLSTTEDGVKKRIVVAARDNWANYFSRFFPVSGESGSDVQLLAVSHRGLRLLKVTQASSLRPHQLKILCSYSFAEVLGVECRGSSTLQLSLKSEQLVLHTARARAIEALVKLFLSELKKDSGYVIALRSYITDNCSLLSFHRGDLIKLLPVATLEPGWQFGSAGGRSGLFPVDIVQPAAAPDFSFSKEQRSGWHKGQLSNGEPGLARWDRASERPAHPWSQAHSDDSEATSLPSSVSYASLSTDSHNYTMQEFALRYFRKSQALPGQTDEGATGKDTDSLVQYTKAPIQESLLSLSDDVNKLAVASFLALMRFMGDQSKPRGKDEMDLLYELLKLCQEEKLRDEIYCQVIKQVTGHPRPEHCTRGWSFLSLLTGCFSPSTRLMPYLTKFLQDSGPSQELARSSQEHLQRTVKYGGRRWMLPPGEMKAFLKGQATRLLLIHLPGGVDYKTNIHTFTVAAEVQEELCQQMGITEPQEVQEFTLFLIKEKGKLVRPLRPAEYLNSVAADQDVSLHSRRLGWETPLHFDNSIYISTHYSQVLRDYLQGKLPVSAKADAQLARLAALQHLSKANRNTPSEQDLLAYVPQQLQRQVNMASIKNLMGQELRQLGGHSPQEAQISFIEAVSQLPLFGYTVYVALRVSMQALSGPALLGLNRQHLILMDPSSQNLYCRIALKSLQRLHLLSPLEEKGPPGLELNYGSADNPQTIWFELPQAQELLYTTVFLIDSSASCTEWPSVN
ncbi:myosin XVB isoform X6 [Macaca fascicularis]|uniref:myosin XVB isoform X6 n=1 Tax=Macaca fascicularis TaxID=9541 RepID=UPI0032B047B4